MTGRKNNTLAEIMAGLLAPEPPPVSTSDFGPLNPVFRPYSGLKNSLNDLPPFVPPGQSLPMSRYMRPEGPPAGPYSPPQAPPQPPAPPRIQAPEPPPVLPQSGGQGWGGPEPAPGTMPIYDPNTDPRYLPEHWKGAFNNWWDR